MICPAVWRWQRRGTEHSRRHNSWANMFMLPGATCNPNYNTWQIGTRTMWNPHPMLDIGVEVLYTQLNQSNTGNVAVGQNRRLVMAQHGA